MDNSHHTDDFVRKMNTYMVSDLYPGRDAIVSYESSNDPLDIKVVKRLVKQIILEK